MFALVQPFSDRDNYSAKSPYIYRGFMKRFFLYALFLTLFCPVFSQEDATQGQITEGESSAQVQPISEETSIPEETEESTKKTKEKPAKPKPQVEIPNANISPDIDDLTDDEARILNRAVREKQELPLWISDIRRAEVITFGSIPFTMLGVSLVTSIIQWGESGFDPNGFPNPLDTSPDTANFSQDEIWRNVGIAAGISLGIGLTDFIVQMVRRAKAKKRLVDATYLENVTVTPIIHDSPLGSEADDSASSSRENPTVETK